MTSPIPALGPNGYWKSGTGLWQDTSATVPAGPGNPVGRWDDQSGFGFHLVQAASGQRPQVAVTEYKDQLGVQFDHTLSQFLASSGFNKTSAVSAGTWVVAFHRPILSRSQALIAPHSSAVLGVYDSAGDIMFQQQFGNNQYVTYRDRCYHGKAVVAVFDGAASPRFRLRINRSDRAALAQTGALNATTATVAAGLDVGRMGSSSYLTGTILEIAYFPRALSTAEIEEIEDYWGQQFFAQGKRGFHVLGDSIPKGYPFDTNNGLDWPSQLHGLLGSGWSKKSVTTVAYQIAQLELSGGAIDQGRDEWRVQDVVFLVGGTNDGFNNKTGAQALTDMATSVTKRHLYGFEVVVQTLPYAYAPNSGPQVTQADYEVFRAAYNSGVRAGNTGADTVFDLAARPGWDEPGRNTAFYNADAIHLSSAGSADVALAAYELLTQGIPVVAGLTTVGAAFLL